MFHVEHPTFLIAIQLLPMSVGVSTNMTRVASQTKAMEMLETKGQWRLV